jgi:hypothetical protein
MAVLLGLLLAALVTLHPALAKLPSKYKVRQRSRQFHAPLHISFVIIRT